MLLHSTLKSYTDSALFDAFIGLFFTILFYSIFCIDINKGFLHLIALFQSYYMNWLIEGLVFLLVYWVEALPHQG